MLLFVKYNFENVGVSVAIQIFIHTRDRKHACCINTLMTENEIQKHNTVLLAKIVILFEKIDDIEQKSPEVEVDQELVIGCLRDHITKFRQEMIVTDK